MPILSKPNNPHRLLKFLAVLTAVAAATTAIINHVWLGGVVVEERVEFAKSYVQLRENKGTWVEVNNLVFSVRWWASRIWLAGTLAILSVFVWSWLRHGHLPKSVDE